jgi:photosystem II stability/assembly factor-like uncharacterized protein
MFSARAGRNGSERASFERENEEAEPTSTRNKEDVDAGPFGRSSNFRDYLTRREQMVEMLRGIPNPLALSARASAIHQLEQQQATLLGNLQSSAVAMPQGVATSSNVPITAVTAPWTPVGPAPIPDGQTNLLDATRNPVSGRVLAIAVHPTNPDIVYIGTAQGGLYRTLNGGQSWTPLMDNALSLAVGAVTIDPLDPTTLFVGTGEGNFCIDCFFGVGFYIIKNADTNPTLLGPYNSATNTPGNSLASSRSITKIAVNPNDDNTIFVATGSGTGGINGGGGLGNNASARGLFRCDNAMSGAPSCTKLNINGPNGGLNTAVRDLVFEPGNPNNLIVGLDDSIAGGTNGIYRSTNALAANPSDITFTRTLQTAEFTNVMLAIQKTGSTVTVYAATEDDGADGTTGGVRKSTDGGITWSTPTASSQGFCAGQCWYDMPIAVDPTNATKVFGGGGGDYDGVQSAFKKSIDGGSTFTKKAAGLHPDSHAIAVAPSNPSIIYHGNDGGIFKSMNGGETWTSINTTGLNATQFVSLALHPTDRYFSLGGTQDNGTPFLQANGAWKMGAFGDGGYAIIDRNATDTGASVIAYHTYYNAKLSQIGFQRAEGADDINPDGWSQGLGFFGCASLAGAVPVTLNGIQCTDDVLFYAPMAQGPGNPNTIYFGTDHLYRSTDKGTTMVAASQIFETVPPAVGGIPTNVPVSAIGIAPQDDNVRVVGLTNGRVFATTLGAPVLTEVTPPVSTRRFIGRAVIDPANAQVAYVTLVGFGVPDGQHIWKTTNLDTTPTSAVTWSPAGNGIPDVPVNAFAIDPRDSNILYAGTDIGVYRSTDGGASWLPFGTVLPRVAVFDMAIQGPNKILRIATHGRGMWEIPTDGSAPSPTPTPTVTPTPTPEPTPTPYPVQSGDGPQVIQGTYDPRVFPCTSPRHQFIVPAGKTAITVQVNATVPANDISVTLIAPDGSTQTEDTGTCCEALRYAPDGGVPAGLYQVQICQTPNTQGVPQTAPFTYTGTFTSVGTSNSSPTPTPTPTPSPSPSPTPTATPTPPPAGGTLTAGGAPVTWGAGPFLIPNPTDQVDGVPTCSAQLPCNDFLLDVNVPAGYDDQHYVKVQVNWTNPAAQFDLFVYTVNANNSIGKLQAANFFAVNPDVVTISAVSGRYLLRVSPTIPEGDSFTGKVTLDPKGAAAVQGGISTPTFQNFAAPTGMGNSAGEPSIGVTLAGPGYPQGRAMFQSNTQLLRVTFNDSASPATALWEDKSAPNAVTSLDPILFTDRQTGRTITSQLAGACSLAAYTDNASPFNDGDQWVPGQGCGVPAGVDHQTFGGGPLHAPVPTAAGYPNGVYYCSQYGTQAASCALSLDGGLTFGPAIPIFTVSCFGIHGHVKVAPDGTVYVPDSDCSSAGAQTIGNFPTATARQALVFSEDNGLTWSQPQLIPDSNPAPGIVDPSIGIGSKGTIYYGYANSNGAPSIVVGHLDKTNHKIVWSPSQDVGTPYGIKNATFPAVVAGDDDRAAFAFLGTPTGGYYQDQTIPTSGAGFQGVWHVYVAITYNGGQTWTTIDATPNDPVQRGSICNSGTVICSRTPNDRNLLDFIDATIDRQGRVLVAYADGCTSPTCINAGPTDYRKNDYVRKGTIARLTTGKGLLAEFDGLIGAQDVTSMVGLQMTNPKSGAGAASFDLALKNTSTQTIFTPLTLMVSNITSASGRVTVANAGNGKTGVGATWDYSSLVGSDNMFTGGEISLSRNLKFSNPNNEPFTVTFSVVGVLASAGTGGGSSGGTSGTSSSTSGISSSGTTAPLTNALLSVTYNPLLNTVTLQMKK